MKSITDITLFLDIGEVLLTNGWGDESRYLAADKFNFDFYDFDPRNAIAFETMGGEINFCTEQQTVSLKKGQMIALKTDISLSVLALEDSFFLLTVIVNNSS
jgi:hypothetical protein